MEDHQLQQEHSQSQQFPVSEAEDYDMDDDFKFLLSATEQNTCVNLVPVMEVEVHRQRRRRILSVYEENVLGVYEENVCCLIILLWAVRRYTGITLGFRSQGAEQFV